MCTHVDDEASDAVPALLVGVGHREAERLRLLDAALWTVARRGYAEATCSEGIRRAGVSWDRARWHFGDKRECFLAAYDAVIGALLDDAQRAAAVDRPWPERVDAVLGFLLARLSGLPDVARACVVELPRAGREALVRQDRALERLAGLLRPPASESTRLPTAISDQLLVGGVWDTIRITIEDDGVAALVDLRDELAAWVLRLADRGARG